MDIASHQRAISELDTLLAQASELLQRFETTGFNVPMKADYLALHALQARALEQRQQQLEALRGLDPTPTDSPSLPGMCH